MDVLLFIFLYIKMLSVRGAYDKFPDFLVWALLLIAHTKL